MKKMLLLTCVCLIVTNFIFATTYNTPTINQSISISSTDWDSDEEFTIISEEYTTGSGYEDYIFFYFTWDASNLYLGFKSAIAASAPEITDDSGMLVFIDTDPTSPSGSKHGSTTGVYNDVTYNLPFHADYCYSYGGSASTAISGGSTYDGDGRSVLYYDAGWQLNNSLTDPTLLFDDPSEFAISRSNIGNPSAIKICAIIFDETGADPQARATWPEYSYDEVSIMINTAHTMGTWYGFILEDGRIPTDEPWRNIEDSSLPVELSSFQATASEDVVLVEWTTESEVNNMGFDIYRSESSDSGYEKLNENIITGAINSSTATKYAFTDTDVETGKTYYYKLTDISTSLEVTLHGPISVYVNDEIEEVAETFELKPCYPNPFNPSTNIEFSVPEMSKISIKIYDINGKLVKTVTNQSYESGNYKVLWDGSDNLNNQVSAGVYIYKMTSDLGFTQSAKMIFIK